LSKIDLEVAEELDFEIGDCVIVIKQDGSLGKIVVPEMNAETIKSDGYKKMLDGEAKPVGLWWVHGAGAGFSGAAAVVL